MLMGTEARFLIIIGVTLFSLLFKFFTLHYVAIAPVEKICVRFFGMYPDIPNFSRLFRALGWDWANSAIGLWVLACVVEKSNFRQICAARGNYAFIFAIISFIILIVLYGLILKCRYIFLESSEIKNINKWRSASIVWFFGLLMLSYSSWCVVGR